MKKLMLSMALMLSPMAITSSFATGHTDDCGCLPECDFREDCCKKFCITECDHVDLACAGDSDGAVALCVNRTSADACVKIVVDGDEDHATFCNKNCLPGVLKRAPSFPACDSFTGNTKSNTNSIVCCVTDLSAGVHSIEVTQDCPRCSKTIEVEIAEPAAIVIKCVKKECAHKGKADGSASFKVSGGTAPFKVSCDDCEVVPTNPVPVSIDNCCNETYTCEKLKCGKHSVRVIDAAKCEQTLCFNISTCGSSCSDDKKHKKHSSKSHDKKHAKKAAKPAKKAAKPAKKAEKATPAKKGALIIAANARNK